MAPTDEQHRPDEQSPTQRPDSSFASSPSAAPNAKIGGAEPRNQQGDKPPAAKPDTQQRAGADEAEPESCPGDDALRWEGRQQEIERPPIRTRPRVSLLQWSSRRQRQTAFLTYANIIVERIRIAPHLKGKPAHKILLEELSNARKRYVNGEIDDTTFLILVKEYGYNCISEKELDITDLNRIVRRELSQTLASDDVILEIQHAIQQFAKKDQRDIFERIRDDLIHHWQLTAETSAARGRIASILGRIMGSFLLIYLLYPFLQALRLGIEAPNADTVVPSAEAAQQIESMGLFAEQSVYSSTVYNFVVGFHRFIEVFGSFGEFKAIMLGGIGAIISIALSMDRERELNVFSVANFVPRTFGRLLTGIWAAIIMNLVFQGLFENIVNQLEQPTAATDAEPRLLEAIRALAMFAAGFSERFFDRLMSVASTQLGVDFQVTEAENGSKTRVKQTAG